MKLYYSPGACSLSPHIALRETGLPFTLEKVDLKSKKTESGADYLTINPKGAVPALQLDAANVLTEGPAVVQYIADQRPESGLAPRAGTLERYRLMEFLNFIATDVHKNFGPLFSANASGDWKAASLAALAAKFDWLSGQLGSKPYLLGEQFSVADAYLFAMLRWTQKFSIDLHKWPPLAAYFARIAQRPAVQDAMRAEGLIH
jgi:glutathione S-transferase